MVKRQKIEGSTRRRPKKVPGLIRLNTICSSVLIRVICGFFTILLIISGYIILLEYSSIILGNLPSETQKIKLDYSITIFAGSAIFLLVYTHEFKKIVNKIFNVKEPKPKE